MTPGSASLLRVAEAARLLGVEPRQVYDAIERGDLLVQRSESGGFRLTRHDLETYRAAHGPSTSKSSNQST